METPPGPAMWHLPLWTSPLQSRRLITSTAALGNPNLDDDPSRQTVLTGDERRWATLAQSPNHL